MCGSPLRTIPPDLAQNIQIIKRVETILAEQNPDWNNFNHTDVSELIKGPSEAFGVTDKLLKDTDLPVSKCNMLEQEGTDTSALLRLYQKWVAEQKALRDAYMEELSSINNENEQAARRKKDHTPIVYRTLKSLADKGLLREIMEQVRSTKSGY